jgi:3-phosphoglycerate kinase
MFLEKLWSLSDCIGEEAKNAAAKIQAGEVLLENLRFHKEEKQGMLLLQRIGFLVIFM